MVHGQGINCIYSKGNVFYSGVGHSTVTGDMEAKLFVNTMIAAYRASYEPPVVEVTNGEAVLTGIQNYGIEILQEFDSYNSAVIDVNDNWQTAEAFASGDTYTVKFQPVEFNLVATNLECTISYPNGGTPIYVNTITRLSDGAVLSADPVTHKFTGLKNGAEYSFEYPKIYLSGGGAGGNPLRVVEFEIKNDRSASTNVTTLNLRE